MQRKWLISFVLLLLFSAAVYGQDQQEDMLVLTEKLKLESQPVQRRKITWMESKSNAALLKYNPVSILFGGLMFTYQQVFSPQLSASCIYTPSCSNFGKQLVNEFGLVKGVFLTADRITRCNRVSASDISPITVDEHLHLAKDDINKFKSSQR